MILVKSMCIFRHAQGCRECMLMSISKITLELGNQFLSTFWSPSSLAVASMHQSQIMGTKIHKLH
jgi:hypothetical protein